MLHFFKKLLFRNHVVDFVEICNVCVRMAIMEGVKRIINSDMVCRSYIDLNFAVTFLEDSVGRRPSVCRLSLSVTLMHPTQTIEIFGNSSTPFGTLATY